MEKTAYGRLHELNKQRDKALGYDFFEALEFRQGTHAANYAHIISPKSEYALLLLQDVVNRGPKYIESLHDEPRKIALTMSPREFTDDEKWIIDCLHRFSGFVAFEAIILGNESLETQAMKNGMHREWIMISATDAGGAVKTIFGSPDDLGYSSITDEYKHDFEMAMIKRSYVTNYKIDVRPVDFASLPAAAKTIKGDTYDIYKIKLLAWHLGRVPDKGSVNFKDTEKFLDQIEASLIEARAALKTSIK